MKIIFEAKHWQIFGAFVLAVLVQLMLQDMGPVSGAISYVIMLTVYVGWILLLGTGLAKRSQNQNSRQFKIFIWTGVSFILLTGIARLRMLFDAVILLNNNFLNGLFVIYAIISIIIIHSFPAKTLRKLEVECDIEINDYFGDILRLMFWPIGIWTIQPRINKLFE